MKFGEKLRKARKEKKLTQEELAELAGVTKRTIINYEGGESYPKDRKIYYKLAELLGTEKGYFINEDEEFLLTANEKYGYRGRAQAQALLEQASAMFAGGELNDDDKLAFVHEIQELYLESKEYSKRFAPKKKTETK